MQDNKKQQPVFIWALLVCSIFIVWGFIPASSLGSFSLDAVTTSIQTGLLANFGWLYLLVATGLLVFALFLVFSKYGKIRLGKDDDRPEYSNLSWFGMLFSAGMGIGLVFWGVSEPLSHYYNPPIGEGATTESANLAMRYSFFHWGLHAWALYAVVALVIAYFTFRKNAPGTISATVTPLFKQAPDSFMGKVIDVLATFATVFGVAATLGFGAKQIGGGLHYLFPSINNNITTILIIIAVVTVLFMISALTGLDRGVKILSNVNIVIATTLCAFLLIFGPTNFIMSFFTTTLGTYIQNLPSMSLRLNPINQDGATWVKDWTILYWAWWIAWSPFVGTFIARVSKGRTIREFLLGVLFIPALYCVLWFSVFGGTGLHMEIFKEANIYQQIQLIGPEVGLFATFEGFGSMGFVLSIVAILLISVFFITSADSAMYVLGMQTSGGSLNPSTAIKVTWGIILSSTAAVLLYSGGLGALERASILAAFPFMFVIIMMCASLIKELRKEAMISSKQKPKAVVNKKGA
ncbi:glycine betaine uptake BCCT transporter [Metabacillus iocasae]|uniref:Glycine betaine transporter n=1 Tax=Priestia iocasae TaxID=2291674 RepID=A0ABS2QWQ9_9BACI|nr:BCCT family transporter [Metabacillus iocasae]MBM7703920.1 glycine betaine transporter [Metabacillus iocasae]